MTGEVDETNVEALCEQELIERVAHQIRKAGRADRVILGAPMNAKIWKMCGEALPEASRILPNSEVRKSHCQTSINCHA